MMTGLTVTSCRKQHIQFVCYPTQKFKLFNKLQAILEIMEFKFPHIRIRTQSFCKQTHFNSFVTPVKVQICCCVRIKQDITCYN